jgi:hypothetical protein
MAVPLTSCNGRRLEARIGSMPRVPVVTAESPGAVVGVPLAKGADAVVAHVDNAEDDDDDGTVFETRAGCAADKRSSSSPSLSRFARGSSAGSSSCGLFTPWTAPLIASLMESEPSIMPLRRSSGGGRSFWDCCDDGCDERNDDRELVVACRANDCSGPLEGEGRTDGERERLPKLRPLDSR